MSTVAGLSALVEHLVIDSADHDPFRKLLTFCASFAVCCPKSAII